MTDEEPDPIIVHLVRRTLPEQVEWLVMQVALLVAKLNQLERDTQAIITAIQSLENRMSAAERAIPWKAPPKPKPPKFPGRL